LIELANPLKLIHALVGVWFVAGLIGRWVALGYAARASDIASLKAALGVSARFERMVIFGSAIVLLLGIGTAIVQGRAFLGPLQGGRVDWLFVSLLLYLSVLPLVPLVFLPRGRRFAAALASADQQGRVTAELTTAFRDPVVFSAHVYELVAVTVVLGLMLAKPF